MDIDRCLVVAASKAAVRIYSINYEVKLIFELDAGSQVWMNVC